MVRASPQWYAYLCFGFALFLFFTSYFQPPHSAIFLLGWAFGLFIGGALVTMTVIYYEEAKK